MALVLVEGEEQLPGLVGASIDATSPRSPPPEPSNTAMNSSAFFRVCHSSIAWAVVVALSLSFISQ